MIFPSIPTLFFSYNYFKKNALPFFSVIVEEYLRINNKFTKR